MLDLFDANVVLPEWIKARIADGFILHNLPDELPEPIQVGPKEKPPYDCFVGYSDSINGTDIPHFHYQLSGWYVKSGWVNHWIDGKKHRQEAHSVAFVPPRVSHFIDACDTNGHISYHLGINLPFFDMPDTSKLRQDVFSMLFIDALDPNRNPVIEFSGAEAQRADKIISNMYERYDYDDGIIQPILRAELISFFTLAMRAYSKANISELTVKYRTGLADALEYITEHCGEKLQIDDVCRISMMSRRLFTYVFRNTMGMSFVNYLTIQRMIRARDLLKNTDRTMLDIATSCGFSDDCTFRRVFKSIVGMNPKEYRRSSEQSAQ